MRRGLGNMRIQAFLTAAAVNLKRLAAALLRTLFRLLRASDLVLGRVETIRAVRPAFDIVGR